MQIPHSSLRFFKVSTAPTQHERCIADLSSSGDEGSYLCVTMISPVIFLVKQPITRLV